MLYLLIPVYKPPGLRAPGADHVAPFCSFLSILKVSLVVVTLLATLDLHIKDSLSPRALKHGTTPHPVTVRAGHQWEVVCHVETFVVELCAGMVFILQEF